MVYQRKKTARALSILLCLLCLQFQGCAATVYRWQDLPAEDTALSRYSAKEKREYYKKFAIDHMSADVALGTSVKANRLSTLADPDKEYSLESFSPVLFGRVPDAQEHLDKVEDVNQIYQGVLVAVDVVYLLYTLYYLVDAGQYLVEVGQNVTRANPPDAEQAEEFFLNRVLIPYLVSTVLGFLGKETARIVSNDAVEAEYKQLQGKYNRSLQRSLGLNVSSLDGLEPDFIFEE